jgi:hypothetical protein
MRSNAALGALGCGLALAACGSAAHGAGIDMNLVANPAIVQVDTLEDIYAIGDPHGDPGQLAMVLTGAKLIEGQPTLPDQVKWTGGHSVVVIIGDLIDKGHDSLGVIALVRALQGDAAAHGGQVIVTMGNHEAEFLARPLGTKTSDFSCELKHAGLKPEDVGKCDGDIGHFLCALPIAARVNDWFFSHGGNTGGRSIDELNKAIKEGLEADGFQTPELQDENSILEARLNKKGPHKLPWFYNGRSDQDPKTLLAQYTSALMTTEPTVNHLVQGHQYEEVKFLDPVKRDCGNFFQRYGLLFLIDTGMSNGITDSNSGGGALHIKADTKEASVICPNGDETPIWPVPKTDHKELACSSKVKHTAEPPCSLKAE